MCTSLSVKGSRAVPAGIVCLSVVYVAEPSTSVTGGVWYTDNEFDHSLIDGLTDFVDRLVTKNSGIDLATIGQRINESGVR